MNFCVCTFVKNENKYLNEWIEHYKNLGFSSINIFDNNDIDGESPKDVVNDEIVVIDERFRGMNDMLHQQESFAYFYNNNKTKYDWILFCDIDEFLTLEHYNNIEDFVKSNSKFNDYDAIAICWKIYTDNGLVHYDNRPVKERFTTPCENCYQNVQLKSLIKGNIDKDLIFNCHGAYHIRYCNVLGEEAKDMKFPLIGKEPILKECWMNHYRFKTIEEFLMSKYKNFNQEHIKSKWIDFKHFFEINEFTKEKLDVIKSYGFEYSHES